MKNKSNYALIGYPLIHTMSPYIHKSLFELSGFSDANYTLCEIAPENLDEKIKDMFLYDGFNVTIPHKISVIKHLTELDKSAKLYKAVNTVKCKNSKSIGYNTDVIGFLRSVENLKIQPEGNIVVLGCGGAGVMMVLECALQGAAVKIAVRENSLVKTAGLVNDIHNNYNLKNKIEVTSIQNLNSQPQNSQINLLINATPVGMFPHADKCPVDPLVLINTNCVFDAIYNPSETILIKKAREMGIKALSGMSMLVYQAAAAHEIWYDASFKHDDIIRLIQKAEKKISEHPSLIPKL